jgi:hypothetical protein
LETMPLWPSQTPKIAEAPWPQELYSKVGLAGVDLLCGMLDLDPVKRMPIIDVRENAYFHQRPLQLFSDSLGRTAWQGDRAKWNLRHGCATAELLAWLRQDPCFNTASAVAELASCLGVDGATLPGTMTTRAQFEDGGRKAQVAGYVGECQTGSMNGLKSSEPLPSARAAQLMVAFKQKNTASFDALQTALGRALKPLTPKELGQNGQELLDKHPRDWVGACAALQLHRRGVLVEPWHQDGGASLLIWGFTLWGTRQLVCAVEGQGPKEIVVVNVPGTLYVCGLTGCTHQVRHTEHVPAGVEYWVAPGTGELEVSVMYRTSLFRYNRARNGKNTPSPVRVFDLASKVVEEWLASAELHWPTVSECAAAELH